VVGPRLVVVVDLEKDRAAVDLERAKVVFFVWIVGVAKVVVDFDCFHDARDRFAAEGGYARRHEGTTVAEIVPQLVVEGSNLFGLGGFGLGRHGRLQCGWVMPRRIPPQRHRLPPMVDGPGDGVDFDRGLGRATASKPELAAGAADNRYSAGGLINAIAFRWRTNLGSFG